MSNYMDGVPVKISEKYKPPPKVSLPQSIVQRLANSNAVLSEASYDFTLEKIVLSKITEWKTVREHDRSSRCERIRQRQRQNEEKQKQMLTAVSYPSAEDLSSADEDDETSSSTTLPGGCDSAAVTTNIMPTPYSVANHFDTILVPTVVPSATDDTNAEPNRNQYTASTTTKANLFKINYSDFENDTSSPFDNIELKTINDLDILAQVLKTTKLQQQQQQQHSSDDCSTPPTATGQTVIATTGIDNDNVQPNVDYEHPKQTQMENIQNSNQNFLHYPTASPLQLTTSSVHQFDGQNQHHHQQQQLPMYHAAYKPIDSTNYGGGNYLPTVNNYNCYYGNNWGGYSNAATITDCINVNPTISTTDYQGMYFKNSNSITKEHQQQQQPQLQINQNYSPTYTDEYEIAGTDAVGQSGATYCDRSAVRMELIERRLKSKSVPDILKELNDELRDSVIRRTRNSSQTVVDGE